MSDDEINMAITEAIDADPHWKCAKDYCNDLNAMHLAEKTLNMQQWRIYLMHLASFMQDICHATAKEKAKAFLRTLGKWKEAQP